MTLACISGLSVTSRHYCRADSRCDNLNKSLKSSKKSSETQITLQASFYLIGSRRQHRRKRLRLSAQVLDNDDTSPAHFPRLYHILPIQHAWLPPTAPQPALHLPTSLVRPGSQTCMPILDCPPQVCTAAWSWHPSHSKSHPWPRMVYGHFKRYPGDRLELLDAKKSRRITQIAPILPGAALRVVVPPGTLHWQELVQKKGL